MTSLISMAAAAPPAASPPVAEPEKTLPEMLILGEALANPQSQFSL